MSEEHKIQVKLYFKDHTKDGYGVLLFEGDLVDIRWNTDGEALRSEQVSPDSVYAANIRIPDKGDRTIDLDE